MTDSPFGSDEFGASPFDEFFARFFESAVPRRPVRRIDIGELMTEQARELLRDAATQAAEWGDPDLDTDHLLWAATRQDSTNRMLAAAGADPDEIRRQIEANSVRGQVRGEPPALTPSAKRVFLDAHQVSRAAGSSYIGPEHLMFALAINPESAAGRILADARITPEALQHAATGTGRAGGKASNTPTLDDYGRDLTEMAREGKVDPVIGRENEIGQTVEVLSRRTKNNPVLIGDPGVGKTAIVEGIAQRVVDGEVPDTLRDKRVVQLDLGGIVAGTRYRGDFEERLKKVIEEIRAHGDELIVFIDELHTVVGVGAAEGAMSAANMLKPALARGELHVIGATTIDEYRKNIEKDAALERRFQPILVSEPNTSDAIEILRGLRDRYEAHHQVRYTDEALIAAVELSDRYIMDRFLPDKAIDLIDQAGARVRLRTKTPTHDSRDLQQRLEQLRREKDEAVAGEDYERASRLRDEIADLSGRASAAGAGGKSVPEVSAADIAEVVSRATGIPVSQLTEEEKDRLLRLEEHLHRRVIGQDEAVVAVAEAVRRSRAGLSDPDRPIGSFLFLGPTGVGKTELARALAEALFGSEDWMIRIDMSEFTERHTVSRLMGAPPGYVGYEEAGQLTEAVRRTPYAVLLLDELEKAHQDVFNVLLQVLDDGRLTDGQGRTVDFKHTVIIMTSNVGSDLISGRVAAGFGAGGRDGTERDEEAMRDRMMRRLRESFRPEFLNRIDEIIVFRQLDRTELSQITGLLLEETRRRLHAQDITVEFTPEAVGWLAERGYQPEFGARPLRRTIQREVDNRLSSMLLDGRLRPGQQVTVTVDGDRPGFGVSDRQSTAPPAPRRPSGTDISVLSGEPRVRARMGSMSGSGGSPAVPVIDVAPLVRGAADAGTAVAEQIQAACRRHGFFYVAGHGVAQGLLDDLADASAEFFSLPLADKLEIAMERGGRAWRGYFPVGAELTSGRPDLKEGLYFAAELPDDDPRVRAGLPLHGQNLFPRQVPRLRPLVLTYTDELTRLGQSVLAGVALSLGLDAGYFANGYTADPTILFRIFSYPPSSPRAGGWGVGEHTDYGLLTLLAQDDSGGLQIATPGGWMDAPPIPGTFVCNIGDMLDRLTGGWYRSTPHRVRNASGRTRLSFPFFLDPGFADEVPPLPGRAAAADDGERRWDGQDLRAFTGTYGDYLLSKVAKVFPQLRRDVL